MAHINHSLPPLGESYASCCITSLTRLRNRSNNCVKVIASGCYFGIAILAIAESGAALGATAMSTCCTIHHNPVIWLKSSSFSIAWASVDCMISPFYSTLVADEASAVKIALSGNIYGTPYGVYR